MSQDKIPKCHRTKCQTDKMSHRQSVSRQNVTCKSEGRFIFVKPNRKMLPGGTLIDLPFAIHYWLPFNFGCFPFFGCRTYWSTVRFFAHSLTELIEGSDLIDYKIRQAIRLNDIWRSRPWYLSWAFLTLSPSRVSRSQQHWNCKLTWLAGLKPEIDFDYDSLTSQDWANFEETFLQAMFGTPVQGRKRDDSLKCISKCVALIAR